jgi:hypothetical protein
MRYLANIEKMKKKRRRENLRRKPEQKLYLPYTQIANQQLNLLLDSGCIGRDFITRTTANKLKLNIQPLLYPIEVKSIHGDEIATEVVKLLNIPIKYEGQTLIIPEVFAVLIEKAPADVILGHYTLRSHGVYQRCGYFAPPSTAVENGAVKGSGHEPQPAGNHSNATFASLGAKISQSHKRIKRIHISQILRYEEDEIPEELLPEDIYDTYWQNPEREKEFTFNVKGSVSDQQRLLKLLNENIDIFSKTLSKIPAKLNPMKMEVDYDAFKNDKRSREPTRAQTAARKMAIREWIRQAIADAIIKPSSAEAWSQLMLAKKPNGKWRFAIDYRALNKYTKTTRAQIPNI